MIISDLNYMEVATEEVAGGTWKPGFNFHKNINTNVHSNTSFNSSSYVNDYFNKYANIHVYSNVKGNSSSLAFDNEAVGYNSNTQGTLKQLTVGGYGSHQSGTFVAAANY